MTMTTAARRLHHLLQAAESGENAMIRDRWAAALDAQPGTQEFALRHAAVIDLWHETVGVITALPASSTRNRRLSYATAWWNAIVMPDAHWGDGSRHTMIDQSSLDMLDSAAEYLEELDGGATDASDIALTQLRVEAEQWLTRIAEVGLPKGLATALTDSVNNLLWLIDNADRFGTAPIVAASERVTGGLIRTGSTTFQPRGWWQAVVQFVGAITLVAGGLTAANNALDQAQHMGREIAAVVQQAPDPDEQPPAIEGPPTSSVDPSTSTEQDPKE